MNIKDSKKFDTDLRLFVNDVKELFNYIDDQLDKKMKVYTMEDNDVNELEEEITIGKEIIYKYSFNSDYIDKLNLEFKYKKMVYKINMFLTRYGERNSNIIRWKNGHMEYITMRQFKTAFRNMINQIYDKY